MIVLDYRDSRPLYQQVKDSLRRMMLTGLLEPDEKLPSVRSLATQLAINPNTIQRAYAELEAEGYIYSVAGKGSFVSTGDGEHLRRVAELTGRGSVGGAVSDRFDRILLVENPYGSIHLGNP